MSEQEKKLDNISSLVINVSQPQCDKLVGEELQNSLKLTPDEAKRKITLFLDEGTVEPSFHCRQESMRKRNVSMPDVVKALETGEVIKEPEWDDNFQNWKYRVEGVDTEGDELTAVTIIFDVNMTLFIVTVF
jgi:hypothetical protein